MDGTLAQILVGLMTNALSRVVEKSWLSATSESLDSAIAAASQELSEVERLGEIAGADEVAGFLAGPEAKTCICMLFVAGVQTSFATTEELRESFVRAYQRDVSAASEGDAGEIFDCLVVGVEKIVVSAARLGDAEASEAVAAARFRSLAEEIQGLRQSLEALRSTEDEEVERYLAWERIYREQVLVRHGTITPPSFDASERVPVDEIYVETTFTPSGAPNVPERRLSSEHLAQRLDRTVVLGDPGAGKSTFAFKLAYDLARERTSVPGGALTPLVVTLKDYGAEKAVGRVSLVEWIESVANVDYAVPPPAGGIHYLLSTGRAVVILDGLDELLDTADRREITADIETFAARYAAAPILVTSRRVGYVQAPLDPRRFEIVYLAELDEEQVERYADLWFGLRLELTPKERSQMAANFMRDSAGAAADLRRNTLMLALLCNIYRGDGYIPRHRPQVYEKCAVMLFERWDRGRRIEVALEFERHLRPAMQHLAFWIYSEPQLRGGVTEAALVRSATEYLTGRRFDDEDKARQEARRFVEFCRGRAWVFTDTGTTASGENLYQFTHRTFLEFFAAEHLVRTQATPAELGDVLRPRIEAGEWDVVAQLAFQLQDDNIDGAADELLTSLLEGLEDEEAADAALGFAARSLAFLVPRRQTCRAVSGAVIRRTLEWLVEDPPTSVGMGERAFQTEKGATVPENFAALICCDRENLEPVAEAVVQEIGQLLGSDSSLAAAEAAVDAGCSLDMAARGLPRSQSERWEEVQAAAFDEFWPHLRHHMPRSLPISYDAVLFGRADLAEFASLHSPQALFEMRRFRLHGNRIRGGLAEWCLDRQLDFRARLTGCTLGTAEDLEALGAIFATADPPWDLTELTHTSPESDFIEAAIVPRDPKLEGLALFGGFTLLAYIAEHTDDEPGFDDEPGVDEEVGLEAMLDGLSRAEGWPRNLGPWIAKRYALDRGSTELPELPMDAPLAALVEGWARREWSVVEKPRS